MNWKAVNDLLFLALWSWICFRLGKWYAGGLSVEQVNEEVEKLRAMYHRGRKASEDRRGT